MVSKYLKATFAVLATYFSVSFGSIALAEVTFGEFQMVRNSQILNNLLRMRPAGRAGFRSFAFVGKVGGINFEAVAELPADRSGEHICPHYSPADSDGSRLKVEVGDELFSTLIYDWELIPIASYADSEYTSVVSLFGPETDESKFHITYHPAFEDTLLGLRLLQADALLINPAQFSMLPKYNSNVIIGAGESDFPYPTLAVEQVNSALKKLSESDRFSSWVISDVDRSATIEISNGALTVNLEPYHYFWRADDSASQPLISEYSRLYIELLGEPSEDRSKEIGKRMDEIRTKIDTINPEVVEARSSTEEFETNRNVVDQLNPPVASALRTTAQFAALFRLAKKADSQCWNDFLMSLSSIRPTPSVETPNIWPKSP
jgi:hypothetical protein